MLQDSTLMKWAIRTLATIIFMAILIGLPLTVGLALDPQVPFWSAAFFTLAAMNILFVVISFKYKHVVLTT